MQGITGVPTQTQSGSRFARRTSARKRREKESSAHQYETPGRSRDPKSNVAHIVITDKVAPDDIHAWLAEHTAAKVMPPMASREAKKTR